MMTLKQGEEINKRFSTLSDSIENINGRFNQYVFNSSQRLQRMYYSYNEEYNKHKFARAEADSFKAMYLANKKIYMNTENEYRRYRINSTVFVMVSFFIAILTATSK